MIAKTPRKPTPRILSLLLAATVVCGSVAARAEDQDGRPHEYNRGFQLGAGWGRTDVDLNLDGTQLVPAGEAGYDPAGQGLDLVAGWGFGPAFRTEFALGVAAHDSDSAAYGVYSGTFRFDGIFTLAPRWRVQPELIAGMGWGGVVYTDADEPDYLYGWLQGDLGAGLRWRLGEHWSLDGQYIYSLLNVEREFVNDGSDEETNYVEGDGHLQRMTLRLVYDF